MEYSSGERERKRVDALKLYGILDTLPEQEFDDITRLASEICQTPIALISLVDEDRQWFKSRIGIDITETSRDVSFCAHGLSGSAIFEVSDPTSDERFAHNPLVTGAPFIRYYAGAPLITTDGYALGTLCVIHSEPHHLTDGQKKSLEILARSVMSLLELRYRQREAEFFQRALDEIAAVAVVDDKYDFIYANDKFSKLVELPVEEIIGAKGSDIKLADISEEDSKAILEQVRARKTYTGRIKNQNKKGDVSWSRVTIIPFVNDKDEIIKVFSIRIDVTERVLMVERLEEAEKLAGIGSWELNVKTGKRFWSKGMCRLMGFGNEESVPPHITMLDFVIPEQRDRLASVMSDVIRGVSKVGVDEIIANTRDGKRRHFAITQKITTNTKGEVTLLSGTIQDITERNEQQAALRESQAQLEESEGRYRSLVEETSQLTYTTDADGHYTYVSSRLKQLLGYDDGYILGKQFAFIYDDEWRKKTIKFYIRQREEKIEESTFVFPIRNKDGAKIWIEQIATLVVKDGISAGFRCVLHDITERIQTEEAMKEAARLAMEAKEMQQNFLSRMSHEIRTPMNGVMGMANLLRTTPLNARQRVYVDSIKDSAGNLLRIINDILDISKIQAGKVVFEDTDFELKNLVDNVIFTLKPTADEKRIILASHIDNKIPATLIADPVRLNQVLLNLAGNALKFTERGSVIISVEPVSMSDEQVSLEFKIMDTGIGIPADKLDSIFESFTQAESSTTRRFGGTGLGLAIARQLVEQQNGTIGVESELGRGTTFTFTFHCKPGTNVSAPAQVVEEEGLSSLDGVKVLLVEDNMVNQVIAQHTMTNWGVQVTVTDRGAKAIEILRSNKFDLVLMDIQMPEMSGIEATQAIRSSGDNTSIVAMTASAMLGERDKCLESGMTDYFSKPFEPEDLHKMIAKHVRGGTKNGKEVKDKLLNVPNLMRMLDNDIRASRQILEIFVSSTPGTLVQLEQYKSDKNFELLSQVIHNLKNTIGILGKFELNELLANIEHDITNHILLEVTLSNLRILEQKLSQLISEARTELSTM